MDTDSDPDDYLVEGLAAFDPSPARRKPRQTTFPFATHSDFHPCTPTARHWQLQDLLCCPDDPDEVFYSAQESIRRYHFGLRQDEHVLTLPFAPTHFQLKHGFLAAVGNGGELFVYDRTSRKTLFNDTCSRSINNSCHIQQLASGDLRLVVCSNDLYIKVFTLPDVQLLTAVYGDTAVNYCAVSPTGTTLIAVGDSDKLYIYDLQDGTYRLRRTLTAFNACAFACCFSPCGLRAAAAAQDGTIALLDATHPTSAATLVKAVAGRAAQCRTLKYSPVKGADIIAFAGARSFVHLMDAWDPESFQVVRVAPETTEKKIHGLCFSPDSAFLYVAVEDGIQRLAVDVTARFCSRATTLF